MKLLLNLFVLGLSVSALAQQPTATPKKDPFEGFGHTGLDSRPVGKTTSGSLSKSTPPPSSVAPARFAPQTGVQTGAGIVLAGNWQSHTAQASGGQTMKIADLQAVLIGFGSAGADLAPHPEATVYEGQRMDGAPGDNCRIPYLMPLDQAEAQLFHSRGLSTTSKAVAPGLPDGLFLHTYDVRAGIYNRPCIVTDNAKPEQQVVSLVLKAEAVNYYPPHPFRKIERDWHTFDYVNTENRGGKESIDTRVNDARSKDHCIVVNATGGPKSLPLELANAVIAKPARSSPKETMTWYVPEPMIKLILYCLDNQGGH